MNLLQLKFDQLNDESSTAEVKIPKGVITIDCSMDAVDSSQFGVQKDLAEPILEEDKDMITKTETNYVIL